MPDFVRNNIITSKCTICDVLIDEVYEHPILKVSICKMCSKSRNRDGHVRDRCLWCGHGDEMVSCVLCCNQCCVDCLTRNIGLEFVNTLNEENWSCFVCDSDPIKEFQEDYMRLVFSDMTHARVPGGCVTSVDISSPIVLLDESEETTTTPIKDDKSQDLDFILNVYERQIQSSLELDSANMAAILSEMNSIKTDQLQRAIYSYKKCVTAFMSDLTNLETRVNQAHLCSPHTDTATRSKLTALLKILVQHHVFNRLCHPEARIKDDLGSFVADRGTQRSAVVAKVVKSQTRVRVRASEDESECESQMWHKRPRLSEVGSRPRSLATPSWLANFSLDREDAHTDHMDVLDRQWTDLPARRGRPPKNVSSLDLDPMKRARGRPKKTVFINVKEPRYCVPKSNGERLATSM